MLWKAPSFHGRTLSRVKWVREYCEILCFLTMSRPRPGYQYVFERDVFGQDNDAVRVSDKRIGRFCPAFEFRDIKFNNDGSAELPVIV